MNRNTEQLLADTETLGFAIRVCPHCQQATLEFLDGTQSCHCTNRDCAAWMVTLPVEQFITLTPGQLATYAGCRRSLQALDTDQEMFDDKVNEIMARLEARKAARNSGEKLFS